MTKELFKQLKIAMIAGGMALRQSDLFVAPRQFHKTLEKKVSEFLGMEETILVCSLF